MLYTRALELEPRNTEALHHLAVLADQVGQTPTALQLIARAIAISPTNARLQNTLGTLFLKANRFGPAAEAFRRALHENERLVEAHANLAIALQAQGELAEAIECCRRAIALNPGFVAAHSNFGGLLLAVGRLEEAEASCRRAVALDRQCGDARYNLGNILRLQERLNEAEESYREAIACRPSYAEAHCNLGLVLRSQGRFGEAVASFEAALAIRPDYTDALNNLGVTQQEQGRLEAAVACYRRAVALNQRSSHAYFNLGSALHELDCADEAAECYRLALTEEPNYLAAYSNLLYLYASTRCVSPEEERVVAEGWERAALSEIERDAALTRRFDRPAHEGRKLRLGIVSAELGEHAVAEFLEPLLHDVDRDRFSIELFPTMKRFGERADRMKGCADACTPLSALDDAKAAEVIRNRAIDVLMDTTGHTRASRLGIFAHRAAPVQLSYIGYWSTTGLSEMDWVLGDNDLPPSCEAHFRERVWRLPRLAVCYRGDPSLPSSQWQPDPDGTIWLGSFNRYAKIRRDTLELWAKVLHAIPRAKLLLEDRSFDDSDSHHRIVGVLTEHGIAPERVSFQPFMPGHERHMRLYDRLDIALDTVPFNSGTTACDALWMGAPLIALEGTWAGGRIGSAFLKAIGRGEWVAADPDEYVAKVRTLAEDVPLRRELRRSQRERMASSPLCDSAGLARALEDAFEQMFDDWYESKTAATHTARGYPVRR